MHYLCHWFCVFEEKNIVDILSNAFLLHFCAFFEFLMHFLCNSYALFMHFIKVHKKYMYFDLKYMHFLCTSTKCIRSA